MGCRSLRIHTHAYTSTHTANVRLVPLNVYFIGSLRLEKTSKHNPSHRSHWLCPSGRHLDGSWFHRYLVDCVCLRKQLAASLIHMNMAFGVLWIWV